MEDYQLDFKDIYLKKGNEIIGLHGIGYKKPYECTITELDGTKTSRTLDFMYLEKYGNKYDENFNMLGGSFRIFNICIEDAAKEYEADGWVRFNRD
jgi:hypothetical protein